jgi:hypothetical protein
MTYLRFNVAGVFQFPTKSFVMVEGNQVPLAAVSPPCYNVWSPSNIFLRGALYGDNWLPDHCC